MVRIMPRRKNEKTLKGQHVSALSSFDKSVQQRDYIENLKKMPKQYAENMVQAGIDVNEKSRSGTYIQMDHSVVHSKSLYQGLEVFPISEALKRYSWLKDYYWKNIQQNKDEFTKKADTDSGNGYFLRALPGVKTRYPLQACLFMDKNNQLQTVHNIIIAEEGSDLEIITGCAASSSAKKGMHIGISEFYVKKNARITFTMIHNWSENLIVRPRSYTVVEDGGTFISNYICIKKVKDIQMYPTCELSGKNAVARFNSILFAMPGSSIDIGSRVLLNAKNSKAEIISRAVSAGGNIIARGHLRSETPNVKGHLECRGLMLNDKGLIHAVPELQAHAKGVDLSHEAAVGKIAKDEIEYLMSRGLSEYEAQASIVRGFLDTKIMNLPDQLQKSVDTAILKCKKDSF